MYFILGNLYYLFHASSLTLYVFFNICTRNEKNLFCRELKSSSVVAAVNKFKNPTRRVIFAFVT